MAETLRETQPRDVTIEGDILHLASVTPIQLGGKTVMSYLQWKRAAPDDTVGRGGGAASSTPTREG